MQPHCNDKDPHGHAYLHCIKQKECDMRRSIHSCDKYTQSNTSDTEYWKTTGLVEGFGLLLSLACMLLWLRTYLKARSSVNLLLATRAVVSFIFGVIVVVTVSVADQKNVACTVTLSLFTMTTLLLPRAVLVMLMANTLLSAKNPFVVFGGKQLAWQLFLALLCSGGIPGLLSLSNSIHADKKMLCGGEGWNEILPICAIAPDKDFVNLASWGGMYIPIILMGLSSLGVLWGLRRAVKKGFKKSLQTRKRVLNVIFRVVSSEFCFLVCLIVPYFALLMVTHHELCANHKCVPDFVKKAYNDQKHIPDSSCMTWKKILKDRGLQVVQQLALFFLVAGASFFELFGVFVRDWVTDLKRKSKPKYGPDGIAALTDKSHDLNRDLRTEVLSLVQKGIMTSLDPDVSINSRGYREFSGKKSVFARPSLAGFKDQPEFPSTVSENSALKDGKTDDTSWLRSTRADSKSVRPGSVEEREHQIERIVSFELRMASDQDAWKESHSISSSQAQRSSNLLDDGESVFEKKENGSTGQSLMDDSDEPDVVFKEYAPSIFKGIRQAAGISNEQMRDSIGGESSIDEEQSFSLQEKLTEGRGGSFFYWSSDKKFVIKTISEEERQFLIQNLDKMARHMSEKTTMLSRYFGLYSIDVFGRVVEIVVMENCLNSELPIDERYDLKGSWVARTVYNDEEVALGRRKNKTQKDLDMDFVVKLGQNGSSQLRDVIAYDAKFLASLNIMDYSILAGFHYLDNNATSFNESDSMSEVYDGVNLALGMCGHANPPFFRQFGGGMRVLLDKANPWSRLRKASGELIVSPKLRKSPTRMSAGLMKTNRPKSINMDTFMDQMANTDVILSTSREAVMFLGLIDFLQEWNQAKKMERLAKIYLARKDKDGISAQNVDTYKKRFMYFVNNTFVP